MFFAKYVFIDEHIALSLFSHQKSIWITNLKKEYGFWTYSFKDWLMSVQGVTGIKKVGCGQTNLDVSEVFIHDSKISEVLWCKGKHNLLQWILNIALRYTLRTNKFMNSANFRNLPNPLILPLVCLSFHNEGIRPPSCLFTVCIHKPTFLSNADESLVLNYYLWSVIHCFWKYYSFFLFCLLTNCLWSKLQCWKSYFQWHLIRLSCSYCGIE